uniref:Uncharacterized protein n=1 Tax=Arion vulgaris TaxID=1028688 RepID=A0A0B7B8C6_9EUPU
MFSYQRHGTLGITMHALSSATAAIPSPLYQREVDYYYVSLYHEDGMPKHNT